MLDIVCAVKAAFDQGRESAVVQINFSFAFDRVSLGCVLFKLRDVGVVDAVFNVILGS